MNSLLPYAAAIPTAVHRGVMLIVTVLSITLLQAQVQTAPTIGAFQFSDGVHSCFDAVYELDLRAVEGFWRDELKAISVKVSSGKELVAHAARIPSVSADTLRIFLRVERPKGSAFTTVHIAFHTIHGFVGPDSPKREVDACSDFVKQRSVILNRRFAQVEFDQGQSKLKQLMRDMDLLKREKDRADQSILSAQQRDQKAIADKAKAIAELEQLKASPVNDDLDSTAQVREQKDRMNDEKRLQKQADKATRSSERSAKQVEAKQWAIKQNEAEQLAKQTEIDRQQLFVQELEEKLKAIH